MLRVAPRKGGRLPLLTYFSLFLFLTLLTSHLLLLTTDPSMTPLGDGFWFISAVLLTTCTDYCVSYFSYVTTDLGDSLLFFPLHPDGTADHDAVHGGCAVRGADDVKWIAQQWFTRSGEADG